jgi:hypothetical protein
MGTTDDAVIYEVNLDLDVAIRDEYVAWLLPHMRAICTLSGFIDAQLFGVVDPAADANRVSLCVQYTLRDAAALDAYLRDHAPRMRAEGEAKFGGRFRALRRVMRLVDRV